mmetsp:Transcript_120551/g.327110  ORF Transcript_120551/g.327110 Transcript_120551/m.327110 type:complete len:346 (+) Transcript_120551:97-1134(+)
MLAAWRAGSLLQVVGAALALSGPRAESQDGLGAPGPGAGPPLYGWTPGDELRAGGPEQASGAHSLASRAREVPAGRLMGDERKAKGGQRFAAHLRARILLPKAKLAFCYMPKVASTEIARLFGDLNGVSGDAWKQAPWDYSGPAKLHVNWDSVTKENGWKFAFLYRDPLARYLSAFGSKCMVNANNGVVEGGGKDCLGTIHWAAMTMEGMVEAFEDRVRADALKGTSANNSHWFPMIKNLRACGIDKFHPDIVDFKGSIDEDANSVVRRMFEATGVIQAYPNASALIDKHFPRQTVGGHSSKSHNRQDEFYRNASTVQAVARLYEEDFQRLRLKVSPQMHSILMG